MVGNFIADAVKGKKYLAYETGIQRGILMHREIDHFTDTHPIVSRSKSVFRRRYGLFSSILVDLFYDHLLAANWNEFSDQPLSDFAEQAYRVFEAYLALMPEKNRYMFPYMQRENWLLNYEHLDGIRRSLNGMSQRIAQHPGLQHATEELQLHYSVLESDFREYFPQLQQKVAHWK
jgi:acyl carrier protein phosphodiesterase